MGAAAARVAAGVAVWDAAGANAVWSCAACGAVCSKRFLPVLRAMLVRAYVLCAAMFTTAGTGCLLLLEQAPRGQRHTQRSLSNSDERAERPLLIRGILVLPDDDATASLNLLKYFAKSPVISFSRFTATHERHDCER